MTEARDINFSEALFIILNSSKIFPFLTSIFKLLVVSS